MDMSLRSSPAIVTKISTVSVWSKLEICMIIDRNVEASTRQMTIHPLISSISEDITLLTPSYDYTTQFVSGMGALLSTLCYSLYSGTTWLWLVFPAWKHMCIFIQYNVTISVAAIHLDIAPNRVFIWMILLRAVDVAAVKLSIAYSAKMAIREDYFSCKKTHRNRIQIQIRANSCLSASNDRSKSEPACCDFYCKR